MNTRPNVSQADRDAIEDLGLADVLERIDDARLLHVDEREAS
jgi:hypothetical protein